MAKGRTAPAAAAVPGWRAAALLCALLAVPLILAAQFFTHITPAIVDDHFFGFVGQRLAAGDRMYLDVWDNKPPLIYWLNGIATLLAGNSYFGPIVACCAMVLLTHALLFGVLTRLFARGVAFCVTLAATIYLTHPVWLGGANRPETGVVFFELAALACYLRSFHALDRSAPDTSLRGARFRWLAAAGAACGLALLCKQSGVAALGAIIVHLAVLGWDGVLRWRIAAARIVALLAGVCAVVSIAGVVLAARGGLLAAYFAVIPFNRLYFAGGESNWFDLYRNSHILIRNAAPVLQLPLVLACAAVLHAAARVLWRDAPPRRPEPPEVPFVTLFGATWFILAAYAALLSPHHLPHYVAPVVPPLLLLSAALLHGLTREWGLRHAVSERASIALLLAVCGAFLVQAAWRHMEEDWRVAWERRAAFADRTVRLEPTPWEMVGARVKALSAPHETLHVWGFFPGVYLAAERRPVVRFFTTEKLGHLGSRVDFICYEIQRAFERTPPDWFVLSARDWDHFSTLATQAPHVSAESAAPSSDAVAAAAARDWFDPWLGAFLHTQYIVVAETTGEWPFVILKHH